MSGIAFFLLLLAGFAMGIVLIVWLCGDLRW